MTALYKGYKIQIGNFEPIKIIDPRLPQQVIYQATSIEEAWHWIDAYRAGEAWAVQEASK